MSAELYLIKSKFYFSVEKAGLLIIKISNTDFILIRSLTKLKFEIRSVIKVSCFIINVKMYFLKLEYIQV
jgi:hypothetical protein